MTITNNQQTKALQFHELHHSGKLLLLPNIWDSLGARLLESLQYPAIATASASIAFSNGYNDGEYIPFDSLLRILTIIVDSVNIPVSADIESGYAANDHQLRENIKQLIACGIVGINIEDTNKKTNALFPVDIQCNRIRIIKNVAVEMGISILINARTDVYLQGKVFESPKSKLEETIKRGIAYKNAGADCFYPVTVRGERDIEKIVGKLQMPVNILTIEGIPELIRLQEIGVARVSLGPSFLKIAISGMKEIAEKLKTFDGLSEITGNKITSDYLKNLVNKNY